MMQSMRGFFNRAKLANAIAFGLYAGCAVSGAVLAESAAPLVIEEVYVTAEKREQSLQDVPISIRALDQEMLEKFQIDDIEDFNATVPNVVVNEYFGIATTFRSFIRGIGAVTVEVTQDPAVALYVDGIYVGSSYGGSFESSDLERIEVLRGPQGTLYGRNATGGAINLVSKKPELGEWQFNQSITTGNYGRIKSHTSFNAPLGDKAALKVGYLVSQRDGIVENTGNGDDYGVEDRTGLRLGLKVVPTDTFEIDWSAEYSTIEDTVKYSQVIAGDAAAAVAGTGTPINLPLGPPGAPTVDIYYADPVTSKRLSKANSVYAVRPDDNDVFGTSLTLSWDMNESTELKSITGYRKVDATQYVQITGSIQTFLNAPGVPVPIGPYTLGGGETYEQEFEQFTQEFQAVGDVEWFGGNLEYATGLYYYRDEGKNRDMTTGIGGPKDTDLTDTENTSTAIYGQATYTPDDSGLHITLGARYSKDNRKAQRTNLNVTPPFIDAKYDRDFTNFSPSLTIAYDLTDRINVYGKVVTGYRSGGTSTLSFSEALFQAGADEETIVSYELGMKGDFLEQRLRINAAIFKMEYDDYQGSIQTGPTPANRDIVNLGDNAIKGVEVDITALLSERFTFSLAVGYLDTEMGNDSFDPGTGAPPALLVTEMPYAPNLSYSASLDYYDIVLDGLALEGHIGYSYQGESESGILQGTSNINDEYGLLDASIALSQIAFLQGELKLMLWGKNLTNEEYALSNIGPFAQFGAEGISPFGDPRTYGITLTYQYR